MVEAMDILADLQVLNKKCISNDIDIRNDNIRATGDDNVNSTNNGKANIHKPFS